MAKLSQKESMILKDLKSHEEWCIKKYSMSASSAQDPELKKIFTDLSNQERQHLNTLNQIERGETVSVGSSSGSSGQGTMSYNFEIGQLGGSMNQNQTQSQLQKTNQQYQAETGQMGQTHSSNNPFTRTYQASSPTPEPVPTKPVTPVQPQTSQGVVGQTDYDLCYDLLNTEKYVSSTYNTAIFEFTDHNYRQALNHIQKEEQEHGEKIYQYLKSKGAYPVQ